jgi:hypothetical protein
VGVRRLSMLPLGSSLCAFSVAFEYRLSSLLSPVLASVCKSTLRVDRLEGAKGVFGHLGAFSTGISTMFACEYGDRFFELEVRVIASCVEFQRVRTSRLG